MQSSVEILSTIKEIEWWEECHIYEINERLSSGWLLIAVAKKIADNGSEIIYFYLGKPQERQEVR